MVDHLSQFAHPCSMLTWRFWRFPKCSAELCRCQDPVPFFNGSEYQLWPAATNHYLVIGRIKFPPRYYLPPPGALAPGRPHDHPHRSNSRSPAENVSAQLNLLCCSTGRYTRILAMQDESSESDWVKGKLAPNNPSTKLSISLRQRKLDQYLVWYLWLAASAIEVCCCYNILNV